MISREEARSIAESYVADRGLESGLQRRGIREILAFDELGSRRLKIYGNWPADDCWVAYLEHSAGLVPSDVVLISRQSGNVLYRQTRSS